MKDISISFATTAYIQALNIATGLIAARLLLPEGRGELALYLLWPGLVAELGNLALSDALLYRLAAARASPRVIFATMIALAAALCAVLVPIGLAVLPWLLAGQSPAIATAAAWFMATYIPAYFASLFVSNMFQGRLDIVTWNVVRAIVPTAYLLAMVAIALAATPSAIAFMTAFVAAMTASALVGLALMRGRGWIGFVPDRGEARAIAVYGAKAHASEILNSLRTKLDQAVVARLMPVSELGLYAVAMTVANAPLAIVQTIANVAFPKISAQATHEGKLEVFGRYLRLTVAVVLAINLALWVINAWAIPLLFGRSFAPAVVVANLLLVGLLPHAIKLIFVAALKAWDRALAIPRAELWALLVVAVSLTLLVPRWGLIGAAVSLALAQLVGATLLGVRLARELHVHPLRLMIPTRADSASLRAAATRILGRG